MSEADGVTNKSVVKGIQLLRELARHGSKATFTDLAKAVGLPQARTLRLLNSMEQAGFVDRTDGKYTLGWELARLARCAHPYAGLVSRIQPVLDELAEELAETVTMSVPMPSGREQDVIAAADASHVIGVSAAGMLIGEHWPLYASSTGKILLAEMGAEEVLGSLPRRLEALTRDTIVDRDLLLKELKQVREQGYSVIDNELEEGLISLSRPVRDSAGSLVAILTVHAVRYRFGRDRIPETLTQMQRATEQLVMLMWPGEQESAAVEA